MAREVPPEIYEAFRKIQEKDYPSAESILKEGLKSVEGKGGVTQQALFHSTLGVLHRVKGEIKEAWRHYERAEKLLPGDPSLKIISAKLLIDQFAQYDGALRRLKKVLKVAKGVPSFEHQAYALSAIAYLRKGEKKKAVESLEAAMAGDFQEMVTAENINLDVLEEFLSRNLEAGLCRRYIEKALELAQKKNDEKRIQLFRRLLAAIGS